MHGFFAFVDELFIPEGFEHPPDGFHEFAVHGFIRIFKIDPAAHAFDGLAPFVHVFEHGRAAGFVEVADAEFLQGFFVGEAEFLFDEVFDGQAVAVPTPATFHATTAHGVVAGNDVFHGSGQNVAVVWEARGEGRAIVEDVFFRALALLDGAEEGVVGFPEGENLLFELGEGLLWIGLLEHERRN